MRKLSLGPIWSEMFYHLSFFVVADLVLNVFPGGAEDRTNASSSYASTPVSDHRETLKRVFRLEVNIRCTVYNGLEDSES